MLRLWHRVAISFLGGVVALYFAVAATGLHFAISRLLFPGTSSFSGPPPRATLSFKTPSGNELLMRRYGEPSVGCVVFFPGQHGTSRAYSFSIYVDEGLAVFVVAYPGQDGASGHTELDEIEGLVSKALAATSSTCAPSRTVLVGVSLGAMLATYAATSEHVAGLVLSSAAPSLSSAIRTRLRSHLALLPLSLLPLSELLPHDYTLAEALGHSANIPAAIFQGTDDEQTPVELLRSSGMLGRSVQLVLVAGGTHSTTFTLSQEAQLATILNMLRHQRSAAVSVER